MEYTLLKNIAVITMGQSPSSSSYNEEGVGIPFYQGNADFGELYPTARIWCNEPKKIANKNDILISVRAPIGALNYATEQCCIGRGLASITVKDEALRNYVFHLLKANRNKLINQGSGSTFKAIGKSNLEEIRIPIVDEMTQKKIMNLMDATEQTIRQRQIELQLFDDLIKARFVEVFRIWENKYTEEPLNEFLENITYGFTNPMPDTEEGPWKITAKDVVDGKINFNTARKTSQESYNKLTAKSKPQLGNVLLTKDGTLGRTAVVDRKNICVNQSVAVLRVNGRIAPDFLSVLLQMPKYQDCMMANAGGGTIKHIYITKIIKMLIIVPTMEEQKVFLDFVHQVDKSKFSVFNTINILFNI